MSRIITTICFCLVANLAISQVDSSSIDSLRRSIDSTTRAYRAYADSLSHIRDSMNMQESLKGMDRNRDYLVATMREREEKQRRDAYIRIAIGLAGFGLLIFSLIRNRKIKKKKEQEARGGKM